MAVSSLYRVRLEAYHMGSKPLEFEGTNGFVVTLEWSVWDMLSRHAAGGKSVFAAVSRGRSVNSGV